MRQNGAHEPHKLTLYPQKPELLTRVVRNKKQKENKINQCSKPASTYLAKLNFIHIFEKIRNDFLMKE